MSGTTNICDCGGRGHCIETRSQPNGSRRRRYKCLTCGKIWTTREVRAVFVDGRSVKYDKSIVAGARVMKVGGSFQHSGTVVAVFATTAGQIRCVVEFDVPVAGMLHIYRLDQLEKLL